MHPAREYKQLELTNVTKLIFCKSLENTRAQLSNNLSICASIKIDCVICSLKEGGKKVAPNH